MLSNDNSFETFLRTPRGDKQIRLKISRNTLIAFAISLLMHAIILFFVVPKIEIAETKEPPVFEVQLAQPESPEITPTPLPHEVISEPLPEPLAKPINKPKVMTRKPIKNAEPPVFSVPEVLATPEPSPQQVPDSPSSQPPRPQSQSPVDAPTDMMAMVNQKRAQREAQEADAARQNAAAAAAERGPSEDEKRDAKIRNNFKNGTNGIFEITRLESRSASFTFLGWTSSLSNARREFFEVEASSGQDVRLLMIRRMISLIRTHYQGDFDWESHRLGRTIVKSAREEDSAELEEFLMQEFFGTNYKATL